MPALVVVGGGLVGTSAMFSSIFLALLGSDSVGEGAVGFLSIFTLKI